MNVGSISSTLAATQSPAATATSATAPSATSATAPTNSATAKPASTATNVPSVSEFKNEENLAVLEAGAQGLSSDNSASSILNDYLNGALGEYKPGGVINLRI